MSYFETYPDVLRAVKQAANLVDELRSSGWRPNERRTRFALIDPVLRALGWEGVNPAECFIEWDFGKYGRVDESGGEKRSTMRCFSTRNWQKSCLEMLLPWH